MGKPQLARALPSACLRPELVRFDGSGRFFISRDEAWYHLWK